MKNIVSGILLLGLLFGVSCVSEQNDSSQKASALLKQSRENLKQISYKATLVMRPNPKIETYTRIYNKWNQIGTNDRRIETYSGKIDASSSASIAFIQIKNSEGDFYIFGNTAIKSPESLTPLPKDIEKYEQGEHATYTLADGFHGGIPCYIITKKIQADDERCNSFIRLMPNFMKNNKTPEELKELFRSQFPSTEINYIGKNDGFICESTYYNVNGKQIISLDYRDVELNVPLDDNLFKIPENCTVIKPNSQNEFDKILRELRNKGSKPLRK